MRKGAVEPFIAVLSLFRIFALRQSLHTVQQKRLDCTSRWGQWCLAVVAIGHCLRVVTQPVLGVLTKVDCARSGGASLSGTSLLVSCCIQ